MLKFLALINKNNYNILVRKNKKFLTHNQKWQILPLKKQQNFTQKLTMLM